MGEVSGPGSHPYMRADAALNKLEVTPITPELRNFTRRLYGLIDRLETKNATMREIVAIAFAGGTL